MTDPFDVAVAFVLREEGVESNHPQDRGGVTRFGISARAHPTVDIATLTRDGAIALYREHYWLPMRGPDLPPPLALVALDAAVQHGVPTATRLLQRACSVSADGVIGSQTLAAAWGRPWPATLVELCARRAQLYAQLDTFPVFGFGWLRRIFRCQAQALALGQKEA